MLECGIVKFVGSVDNSYEDYRVYVGIKLDEPGKIYKDSNSIPGRPAVATFLPLNYHWSKLLRMEVVGSVAPLLNFLCLFYTLSAAFWRFQHFFDTSLYGSAFKCWHF